MTDVARHARIGRTAVYNDYADIEELLIAYALDETELFLLDLRESLDSLENPVERLAVYVRAQVGDLSRRHLPPGPAMAAVLSPSSFANSRTTWASSACSCRESCATAWPRATCPSRTSPSLPSSSTARFLERGPGDGAGQDAEAEARLARTVRFIQLGAGARFDDAGRPVRVSAERGGARPAPPELRAGCAPTRAAG